MDNTIIELFKEKNDEILTKKLLLDVDNNDDSLRLTINNRIDLVVFVKFLKKVNSVLKNGEIEYDVKTLDEIGKEITKNVKEKMNSLLDVRKKSITSEITNNFNGILNLFEVIDQQEQTLKQELESLINKFIYSELENKLFNLYTFKSEEQKEEITLALKKFDSVLTSNILVPLSERNNILKNMIQETSDKVMELNEKTTEVSSEQLTEKVMKKENV